MMTDLQRKVAVVTGGSSGIGAAIVRLFLQKGAMVVVVSNQDQVDLDRFCSDVSGGGSDAFGLSCDLSEGSGIDSLIADILDRSGRIDILVNCAGLFARSAIEDMSVSSINTLIDVNLAAPIFLTRAVIPVMRSQNSGVIVNISSVGGVVSVEGTAVYAATKAGLSQFTKTVAGEMVGSGVRINAIAPGPVRTGMIGFSDAEPTEAERQELAKRQSLSRSPYGNTLIEPAEIAELALFLVSDSAAAIHGSVVLADQGMSAVMTGR